MDTCILIPTVHGFKFGRRIGQELKQLEVKYLFSSVNDFPKVFHRHPELNQENCFIHPRAAYKNLNCEWLDALSDFEENSFCVINSSSCLVRTSNKATLANILKYNKVLTPATYTLNMKMLKNGDVQFGEVEREYIIKNVFSNNQGKSVHSFWWDGDVKQLDNALNNLTDITYPCIVQEKIELTALYRVIVLNAVPITTIFADYAGQREGWKFSVCLNKNMNFLRVAQGDDAYKVLELAIRAQKAVLGFINFIDIGTDGKDYYVMEINTACNLSLHEKLSGINIAGEIAKTLVEVRKTGGYQNYV